MPVFLHFESPASCKRIADDIAESFSCDSHSAVFLELSQDVDGTNIIAGVRLSNEFLMGERIRDIKEGRDGLI
jgi:hypothetical protein